MSLSDNRPGDAIVLQEVEGGDYDALDLREGEVVIDAGAHRGYFAARAAALVGARGRVFCFEPEPDNYRLLRESVRGLAQVQAHCYGLGHYEGTAVLHRSPRGSGSHSIIWPCDGDDVEIEMMRLDDLFHYGTRVLTHQPIDAMKIDVEGSEVALLVGAFALILRDRPRLAIEVHSEKLYDAVRGLLAVVGYTFQPEPHPRERWVTFATWRRP